MTTAVAALLSRPVSVADLPPEGSEAVVETTPAERETLACEFKLPAIHALTGSFRLSGTRNRVHVSGRIEATITQICVVTLDPFDSAIQEDVEVDFAAPGVAAADQDRDPPDEIVDGMVDLGALTAEFLALGLDPYPRKPGVDFTFEASDDTPQSPFAALGKLKPNG
jgi:uncharacterized metal-binding protein YceD (DUF177 family)